MQNDLLEFKKSGNLNFNQTKAIQSNIWHMLNGSKYHYDTPKLKLLDWVKEMHFGLLSS